MSSLTDRIRSAAAIADVDMTNVVSGCILNGISVHGLWTQYVGDIGGMRLEVTP